MGNLITIDLEDMLVLSDLADDKSLPAGLQDAYNWLIKEGIALIGDAFNETLLYEFNDDRLPEYLMDEIMGDLLKDYPGYDDYITDETLDELSEKEVVDNEY